MVVRLDVAEEHLAFLLKNKGNNNGTKLNIISKTLYQHGGQGELLKKRNPSAAVGEDDGDDDVKDVFVSPSLNWHVEAIIESIEHDETNSITIHYKLMTCGMSEMEQVNILHQ